MTDWLRAKIHKHEWVTHHKSNIVTQYVAPGRWVPVDGSEWESNGPVAGEYWTWDECLCGATRRSKAVPTVSVIDWHKHSPKEACREGR